MAMELRHFDHDAFLRDHWQRQPLLIRNPWDAWANPLAPDELAGLACEEMVESRLVEQRGGEWRLEHGPLAESRFAALGAAPWTLLVQAVDHHVPAVAALIEPFRFVPDWRIDDVMVSYAVDGGGVGPHFDQYDVFLVQGLGRRRWRVGPRCDGAAVLQDHADLRLLAGFETAADWILDPGDILYLPPGFAHEGTAVGDGCMTYSIGFRAPSRTELIAAWCDDVLDGLCEDDRYADPGLALQDNPGEITAAALARLHDFALAPLRDPAAFARMYGRHATTPRYPDTDWSPDKSIAADALRRRAAAGAIAERNPASRFAFIAAGADGVLLFVNGECHPCADPALAALARALCAGPRLPVPPHLSDAAADLLCTLHNRGNIAFVAAD